MSENTDTDTKKINILIVFYTRYGNTARMAEEYLQELKKYLKQEAQPLM
jgi:flavodoxin